MIVKILGFTLVELLIVVSILAVITVLVSPMLYTGLKEGRDSRRKEEIKQYRTALENYATANSAVYPMRATSAVGAATLCNDAQFSKFASSCPDDSKYAYQYLSDSNGLKWILWGKLERSGNYWILCSDGKSGEKLDTDFMNLGGSCPSF